MPAHARTQIRHALKTALTGLTTTGANVHVNRSARLSLRQVPALVLSVEEEQVERVGTANVLFRTLSVAVDGYAAANDDADDVIDQIGREVEVALSGAGTLGGLIKGSAELLNVVMGLDEAGETPVGRIRMLWRMSTATPATQPDMII